MTDHGEGAHETRSESGTRGGRTVAERNDGGTRRPGRDRRRKVPGLGRGHPEGLRRPGRRRAGALLLAAGQDAHELGESVPPGGRAKVQLFLTGDQARDLGSQGVELTERTVSPQAKSRLKAAGDGVYRPYSGPGNLQEEIRETAAAHPGLTKVVSIGKTVQGKDILALKLTKGAARSKDGAKPSVLYMSNQHAREWITPR